MMAIPRDDTRYLQHLSQSIQKLVGNAAPCWTDYWEATKALRAFDRYIDAHIEHFRHSHDAESILSDVVHHGDLTDWEIKMLAGLLLGRWLHHHNACVRQGRRCTHRAPRASGQAARRTRSLAQRYRGDLALRHNRSVGVRIATEATTIGAECRWSTSTTVRSSTSAIPTGRS